MYFSVYLENTTKGRYNRNKFCSNHARFKKHVPPTKQYGWSAR